jgi:magnesium transporter
MIRVHFLENGTLRTVEGADAVPDPPDPEKRFWVEAVAPDPEESIALVLGLGLHELSVEDALSEGHPPKVEDFGSHLFLIFHTPVSETERQTRKVAVFLSPTWIVTIERFDLNTLQAVADRVRRDPRRYLGAPEHLAHAVLDQMTEGFETLADVLMDQAEDLEDAVCAEPRREMLTQILDMRREVTLLIRVVRDQRDVASALLRTADERLSKEYQPYFRDVYEHLVRVHAQLEAVLHGLTATREAYLSSVNNRLGDTMRLLTVLTTIVMPLNLITGVFGMNFVHIPGLREPAAFWGTLVAMTVLGVGMVWFFRKKGWL